MKEVYIKLWCSFTIKIHTMTDHFSPTIFCFHLMLISSLVSQEPSGLRLRLCSQDIQQFFRSHHPAVPRLRWSSSETSRSSCLKTSTNGTDRQLQTSQQLHIRKESQEDQVNKRTQASKYTNEQRKHTDTNEQRKKRNQKTTITVNG